MPAAREYHTQQTHYLRKAVTFANDGTAVTVGKLPAGAVVLDAGVVVTTAFNAGTSNTIDVGTSADDNGFASAIALGTVGKIAADDLATSDDLYSASEVEITATVNLTGTAATAGSAIVYVEYLPDNDG